MGGKDEGLMPLTDYPPEVPTRRERKDRCFDSEPPDTHRLARDDNASHAGSSAGVREPLSCCLTPRLSQLQLPPDGQSESHVCGHFPPASARCCREGISAFSIDSRGLGPPSRLGRSPASCGPDGEALGASTVGTPWPLELPLHTRSTRPRGLVGVGARVPPGDGMTLRGAAEAAVSLGINRVPRPPRARARHGALR